jgi:hypothetical protein
LLDSGESPGGVEDVGGVWAGVARGRRTGRPRAVAASPRRRASKDSRSRHRVRRSTSIFPTSSDTARTLLVALEDEPATAPTLVEAADVVLALASVAPQRLLTDPPSVATGAARPGAAYGGPPMDRPEPVGLSVFLAGLALLAVATAGWWATTRSR